MQKSFFLFVISAIYILFLVSCSKDEIIIYELTQEQKMYSTVFLNRLLSPIEALVIWLPRKQKPP